MTKIFLKTTFMAVAVTLVSCGGDAKKDEAAAVKNTGIDLANIDSTVNPVDDFYLFVNGKWLKNNPIPETESRWGSFNELEKQNKAKLLSILEEAAADKSAPKGSNRQKIGDYYAAAMDSVKLNADGAKPLDAEFAAIDAIKTSDDLIKEVAHLHSIGMDPMFNGYVGQDPKISDQYILQYAQGGIGLPDRDYYTNKDERTLGIQKAYLEHMANMFVLLGDAKDVAEKNAKTVFGIESNLAKASMTKVELRDPEKQYNKKTIKELTELTPALNWNLYFQSVGVKDPSNVIIGQPEFYKELNKDLKSVSLADWKTYLRWHLIDGSASKLSDNFVKEHFNFYGTTLMGIPAMKPRWKTSLEATDRGLGEIGRAHV